jgi:hypothetical protein
MYKEEFKTDVLPEIIGRIILGQVFLVFTSPNQLQDIYVKKNAFTTKFWRSSSSFSWLLKKSIIFDQTNDPNYPEKRKALSGAFFKSKLIAMTKIIKEVTLN